MKKLTLAVSTAILLSGCAAGISDSEPVEKRADLKQVCVDERKTGLNYTSKEIVEFISTSLAKKNISTVVYQTNKESCKYLLKYNFRGKKELIIRGKMTLTELQTTSTRLGEVSYKYRGDEREIAQQVGLKGQIDKMVSELFKNY